MSRRSGLTSTQAPALSDAKLGTAFVMSRLKENPVEPSGLRYMVEGSSRARLPTPVVWMRVVSDQMLLMRSGHCMKPFMVLYVDVKLDPKDGLEYATATELHEKVAGLRLCRIAATRTDTAGGGRLRTCFAP